MGGVTNFRLVDHTVNELYALSFGRLWMETLAKSYPGWQMRRLCATELAFGLLDGYRSAFALLSPLPVQDCSCS
jgi:hypothetical protein